jgi:beta-galactosidase
MPNEINRRDTLKGLGALAALPVLSRFSALGQSTESISAGELPRERLFDGGWRFHLGDIANANAKVFDDTAWREVDLPHDWSIEDLPSHLSSTGVAAISIECNCPDEVGPFSRMRSQGQAATGWVVGGVGWYRKTFPTPVLPKGGRAELRFDGAYMNADVWINGIHLGQHPYGYTGFQFDVTSYLKDQASNVIALRINNEGKNSRWYSGSGIYRHVWLTVTNEIYVPRWGVQVVAKTISADAAVLSVKVRVANQAPTGKAVKARVSIHGPDGQQSRVAQVEQNIRSGEEVELSLSPTLTQPALWSPKTPNLYSAEIELLSGTQSVDRVATTFGIRTIEVSPTQGLRINGESLKLYGGCIHHDNGVLGSAAFDRADERRVELMKANGFNAIRCSHNPPSVAFLDACDRLGMLVIDEAFDMWGEAKNPEDYHLFFKDWWQRDLDAMLLRDRNHPSVIFWSIGNEIAERADPAGVEIAKQLSDRVRQLDPTRPITMAVPSFLDWKKPRKWIENDAAFQHLDVAGYNYEWEKYEPDHERDLKRIMVGTESFPLQASEIWELIDRLPYVLGDFVWTSMDYLGESSIGGAVLTAPVNPYLPAPKPSFMLADVLNKMGMNFPAGSTLEKAGFPWFNSYCGDIDLIGNKKPQSFFRDVVWRRSTLEMAVRRPTPEGRNELPAAWGWFDELRSWTWPGHEGRPLIVRVYSLGDHVRLLLNGKEVGVMAVSPATKLTAEFTVPYAAGELKAVALKEGAPIAEMKFRTVGEPYRVTLHPDRVKLKKDRNDLSFVMVHIEDQDGELVPDAVIGVNFSVSGAGEIAGLGNANPKEMASFRQPHRNTFHGTCLLVVRPSGQAGEITVQATSDSLRSGLATVAVQ